MPNTKAALIIGAGDATGGAIARRFAREGFTACVTRRNADKLAPLVARIEAEGGRARAFGCLPCPADVTQAKAAQFGAEVVHLGTMVIPDEAISIIPRHVAKKYRGDDFVGTGLNREMQEGH
jgi:NAD(P)-dependent dehydrogenase (short-subunit alcohol dehydrogenase family)